MKTEFIIIRESAIQSIVSDIFTFALLFGFCAVNHFWFADNQFTYFIQLLMVVAILFARSSNKRNKFNTQQEAIDFLNKQNTN